MHRWRLSATRSKVWRPSTCSLRCMPTSGAQRKRGSPPIPDSAGLVRRGRTACSRSRIRRRRPRLGRRRSTAFWRASTAGREPTPLPRATTSWRSGSRCAVGRSLRLSRPRRRSCWVSSLRSIETSLRRRSTLRPLRRTAARRDSS